MDSNADRDDAVPSRLYKFRALSGPNLAHVSRIFTHSELYFPDVTQLNDPWECRPLVRIEPDGWTMLAEEGFHEISRSDLDYASDFDQFLSVIEPTLPKRQELLERLQTEEGRHMADWGLQRLRSMIGTTSTSHRDQFHEYPRLRLCSFAATCEHPLLWSHYADSHRGIAIEFNARCGGFSTARAIHYAEDYPVHSGVGRHFTFADLEYEALLIKSRVWSYESELRLIASPPHARCPSEPTYLGDDYIYHFPPEAITGVVFGCQCPDEDRAIVRGWLGDRAKQVSFRRAVLHPTKFQLQFED